MMTNNNYRIPSTFVPETKIEEVKESQEESDLEKEVQEEKSPTRPVFIGNGKSVEQYISTIKKEVKSLEKFRKVKWYDKKYPRVIHSIDELSKSIDENVDYFLSQVPLEIEKKEVYLIPDKTEIDNLSMSKQEKKKRFWSGMEWFALGTFLGAFASIPSYFGFHELTGAEHFDFLAGGGSALIQTIAWTIGYNSGAKSVEFNSNLKDASSNRKSKLKSKLKFLKDVYVNGSFESRISSKVDEIRDLGLDETTAIKSLRNRVDTYDKGLSNYDKILSAKLVNRLGITSTNPETRIIYMKNLRDLGSLERSQGLTETEIPYKQLISEGEAMFERAKDTKNYSLMEKMADVLYSLTEDYSNDKSLSEEDQQKLRDLHYEWGTWESGIQKKCRHMRQWNQKIKKSKSQERVDKFNGKIDRTYNRLTFEKYVPLKD